MKRSRWSTLFFAVIFTFTLNALASGSLTDLEKRRLRYHLENLFNEVDLLLKNKKIDSKDLIKQTKSLENYQIYQHIPLERDLSPLNKSLEQSAVQNHLKLKKFQLSRTSKTPPSPPKSVYTDGPEFHFSQDQIVETLYLHLEVQGTQAKIQEWIKLWPQNVFRLIEPDLKKGTPVMAGIHANLWQVKAHTYRFRKTQFPSLHPRNPRNLLPLWARKDPQAFAQSEPVLWKFVTQIETLIPKTAQLYQTRADFLLNDARLHFFLSKY